MTPTEVLATLANFTPYRPQGNCQFCGANTPLHEPTCIFLEVLPYENTAIQLQAVVELLAFIFLDARSSRNDLGFRNVTINKSFRMTPEIRALLNKYGIKVPN